MSDYNMGERVNDPPYPEPLPNDNQAEEETEFNISDRLDEPTDLELLRNQDEVDEGQQLFMSERLDESPYPGLPRNRDQAPEETQFLVALNIYNINTFATTDCVRAIYRDPDGLYHVAPATGMTEASNHLSLIQLTPLAATYESLVSRISDLATFKIRNYQGPRIRKLTMAHAFVAWELKNPMFTAFPADDDQKVKKMLMMVAQRGFKDVIQVHFSFD
ncbi:uncharacterized protein RCO7_03296 [Rhynchosporium graminicola]|uniref:Uncharacterized protein n=1 Tax=Rhynchosporium graminicola TaxID=2792576 RepID=A0A1E1L781_9HELO|nr:uncharacterized protein RCO7_03296 [Rhynchosporium commune]